MRAERMTDQVGYHCEGPVWWHRLGALRLVDMLAGTIVTLGDGDSERSSVGSPIAAVIRPRRAGGAIIAREHDIALCDGDDLRNPFPIADVDLRAVMRCNEGGCSPSGDFFVGTMAYDQSAGAAALYRLRSGGTQAQSFLNGLTVANGLDWSPDGHRAYHADTPTGVVSVFDVDPDGALVDRRPFAWFADVDGGPDGLTVAADGTVWVAGNGSGAVLGFDPSGQLIERIEVGARQVTACTFGGADLDQLFITTSREDLADDEDPAAGSIFVARPGVRGRLPLEYAG